MSRYSIRILLDDCDPTTFTFVEDESIKSNYEISEKEIRCNPNNGYNLSDIIRSIFDGNLDYMVTLGIGSKKVIGVFITELNLN